MGTTAQKLQNIVNEKASQKTMTNYGLPSAEQIDDNTKFIDYPKYIFNAFLEALRSPDTLFTNLPKKTGTGASITLNDTANAPMRLTLDASALEQETTTGKNLLNLYTTPIFTSYANSSFTEPNISIIKSAPNQNACCVFIVGDTSILNGKTLKFTGNLLSGTGRAIIGYADANGENRVTIDGNVNINSGTFQRTITVDGTTYANKKVIIWLYADTSTAGSSGDTLIYKNVMVSENGGDYEPYTGGIASPNPDYPQDIHVISGHNTITISNSDNTQSQTADIDLNSKNWFNIPSVTPATSSESYNKISDNSIQIIGSANQQFRYCYVNNIKVKPNTTYYFKANYINTNPNITTLWLLVRDKNDNLLFNVSYSANETKTINIGNIDNIKIALYCSAGTAGINTATWYDIQLTTNQYDAYTPYHEPIEYCKIGNYKDEFIRTSGKNLFELIPSNLEASWDGGSPNKISIIDNYTIQTTADYNNWRANCIEVPNIKPNTTYTLNFNVNSSTSNPSEVVIALVSYNGSTRTSISTDYYGLGKSSKTFTTPNDLINFGISISSRASGTSVVSNIMLNEGTTALPYEPYGTNEWYIKKNIGKVVLDGSENDWTWQSTYNRAMYPISGHLMSIIGNITSFCNYFKIGNTETTDNVYNIGSTYIYFRIENTAALDAFKQWLSTHNTIVYYTLSTPTYTQITGTLETQLENIYNKLLSYNSQTNITQTNNDLPFVINASAIENLVN